MEIIKQFKKSELFAVACIYLILLGNVFILHDSPIAFISAFFGITYTILAGKGTPICYIFGVTSSSFYGYLAFHNALWGNLILYMGYYVPMQILGYFKWQNHLQSNSYERKICAYCDQRDAPNGVVGIKERVEDGAVRKPLNDRFNYLLDLEIIDEKSEDKDVYAPYRCKVKK